MMVVNFNDLRRNLIAKHGSMHDILKIARKCSSGDFFIAGGAVRDFSYSGGKINGDIDLFLSDKGYQALKSLQHRFGQIIMNPFGSERWFPDANSAFYYDVIKISEFYHGLWRCQDIIDVLNQFDITANAIAFDLSNGDFFNPTNGLRDLRNKELRAVRFDFPEMVVSKDIPISRNSVLWFRYNHYCNKLKYAIEPITREWITKNKFRKNDLKLFAKHFFEPTIDL